MITILDCDTDSMILQRTKDTSPLPTSTALGELKEEIRSEYGVEAFGSSFFSTGAKSYGILVTLPDKTKTWITRSKGFKITNEYQTMMGPEKILDYLLKELYAQRNHGPKNASLEVKSSFFKRNLNAGEIMSEFREKKLSLTIDRKRFLVYDCIHDNDYTCYPFGFF